MDLNLVGKEVTYTLQTEDGIVYTGQGIVTRIELMNEQIGVSDWTKCQLILDWLVEGKRRMQPTEACDG